MTTTRGAPRPAGAEQPDARPPPAAATAPARNAPVKNRRRVNPAAGQRLGAMSFLSRAEQDADARYLLIGQALGDAVHDGRRSLAGLVSV